MTSLKDNVGEQESASSTRSARREIEKEILNEVMSNVSEDGWERSPRSHRKDYVDYSEEKVEEYLKEAIKKSFEAGKSIAKKEFEEMINGVMNGYMKQCREHIEEFGKGKNRDIDSREKSLILTLPMAIKTKLLSKLNTPDKTGDEE